MNDYYAIGFPYNETLFFSPFAAAFKSATCNDWRIRAGVVVPV